MMRQLQPWYENIGKRQVKAPKIYFRDSGILHSLLHLPDLPSLHLHPQVGASWEGYALEQTIKAVNSAEIYFWASHSGAEIDLFFINRGHRYGVEIKFNEAPEVTKSMKVALNDLNLEHLWILYPGEHKYPIEKKITVWPLVHVKDLKDMLK